MGSNEPHVIVPTEVGDMSVVDFGGTGVDALMFHSPGFCAESLSLVAAALAETCHTYSVELPGHGRSPTGALSAAEFWAVIPEIVAGLGLERPVLVGFDLSGFLVTAAALQQPDLASGVVNVCGWCLRTREETAEFLAFLSSDEVLEGLAERMKLGATSADEAGMRTIMLELARNSIHDFLIEDEEARFADRITCTIGRTADGGFVRLPTLDTLRRLYAIDPDAEVYPHAGLLEQVDLPYLLVLPSEGVDSALLERAKEVEARRPNVSTTVIDTGPNPQMSDPSAVAGALAPFLTRLS